MFHQLYFNGSSWVDQDLTAITGGPLSLGTGVSGFAIGNLQHVFELGVDLHVHQPYCNNSVWVDQDIISLAGGLTDFDSLVAFPTISNGQFHVLYLQNNFGHTHRLLFNGASWSDEDVTALSNGEWSARGWMSGFADRSEAAPVLGRIRCGGQSPSQHPLSHELQVGG